MIESVAAFLVGSALAAVAVTVGVNSATNAEPASTPDAKQGQSVVLYDGK